MDGSRVWTAEPEARGGLKYRLPVYHIFTHRSHQRIDIGRKMHGPILSAEPCRATGHLALNAAAPIWSEHVDHRCVRHVWSCEACGYVFRATVYLSPERNTEADGRAAEIPARLRQTVEECL